MQQAPFYPSYVNDTMQDVGVASAPKQTRVVVSSKDVLGENVDLKKMLGILIILIIVVFFTLLISIVVTLMKPGCKCTQMPLIPPYYAPPTSNPMMNVLPFV